jgi:ankyrin repeat protein
VQLLLEHKADVDARSTPNSETALYVVALGGHEAVVRLLVDHEADIDAMAIERRHCTVQPGMDTR